MHSAIAGGISPACRVAALLGSAGFYYGEPGLYMASFTRNCYRLGADPPPLLDTRPVNRTDQSRMRKRMRNVLTLNFHISHMCNCNKLFYDCALYGMTDALRYQRYQRSSVFKVSWQRRFLSRREHCSSRNVRNVIPVERRFNFCLFVFNIPQFSFRAILDPQNLQTLDTLSQLWRMILW